MKTLNAQESADFLNIDIDTYYDGANSGEIPAVKRGKRWVSIDVDLVQYLRSYYLRKTDSEGRPWGSTEERTAIDNGPSKSSVAAAYRKALGLPIERKPSPASAAERCRRALQPRPRKPRGV